jgi:hypothetical protein
MNAFAVSGEREPTSHDTIHFVSASIAVNVQMYPCPRPRGVALLRADERLYLVRLNALARQVGQDVVLVDRTELAKLDQEPEHGRLGGTQ